MGTVVDYGAAHSAKNGHLRFGKDYTGTGFFPTWNGNNKISIISHSMGGNTARMLEYLLQNGAPEEEAVTGAATSTLFKTTKPGGNNWLHSLHTISAPHDGTPSSLLGQPLITTAQTTLLTFGAAAGLSSLDIDWLYNFDLQQFGLDRLPGESFKSYYTRIWSSAALQPGFVDNAMYDLGPDACWDFNNKTELTYPGTYYFSYSTSQTYVCSWEGYQCPDVDIEVFLAPTALIMGHINSLTCLVNKNYCFQTSEWAENDGVVPARSSRTPQNGVRNFVPALERPTKCTLWTCAYDNTNLKPATWYTTHIGRDHTQIIGLRFNLLEPNAADNVYSSIADVLDAIKSPESSSYEPAFENDLSPPDVDPAAIAVPVVVGTLLLSALAVVGIRRRRSRKAAQAASPEETAKRASVVAFPSTETSSPNPAFGVVSLDEENDIKV